MSGNQGSFVQRDMSVTFTLTPKAGNSNPTFDGQNNQVTVSGLRTSAHIVKAGGASMGDLQLRIYGLPLAMMNQLSTLGQVLGTQPKSLVAVSAGDAVNGMTVVFTGSIYAAWADFNGAPDVMFNVSAYTGLAAAVSPCPPGSYVGSVSAATILQNLAGQLGVAFENNGVSVQLSNPYFPGTAFQQIQSCANAAGIEWVLDDTTLAIWPGGSSRSGTVPLITPDTGMVGYPTFDQQGIVLSTLFNPAIALGGQVKVQSSLTPACGTWIVRTLMHDLEAEMPGGKWFTQMLASAPGYVPVTS